MEFSPEYLVEIDGLIKSLYTSNYDRLLLELAGDGDWSRIMKLRPFDSKRELLTWILDTAGIYPEGEGGQTRFDDMVAVSYEVEVENLGAGLELTTNEIEDNQLKDKPEVGALDFAMKWSKDRAAEAVYHPRENLFSLITNGTAATSVSYDNVPFFSAAHPIDPNNPSGATYSNIITGVPINAATTGGQSEQDALLIAGRNFAKARSAVRTQRFIGNKPRMLRPNIVVCPTQLEFRVNQLMGAGMMAATSNIIQQNYKFDAPFVAPELDDEPDVYYLGVQDMMADELGPFIFNNRKDFQIIGYPNVQSVAQMQQDLWKWLQKGRRGYVYGHPYLFYRCTP